MSKAFERLFVCKACKVQAQVITEKSIKMVQCPKCARCELWNDEVYVGLPLESFQPVFRPASC